MDKPEISRPRYVSGNTDPEVSRYEVDAYQERTYEQLRSAKADRLASTRLEALKMAYEVLKQEPGTFSLDDVKTLADQFVDYAREGNQPVDGTPLNRFHGK
jgi:hypothetical protein